MSDPQHTYMLYARVSPKGSDWHAEETSVALQLSEMREYILRKDPDAQFLTSCDEFRSGKDLNRPGIQSVLADLDRPEPPWGTLVVWALDRLSRSLADAVPIFEKLRDAGRGFVCIRQDWLSTRGAMARFTLNQTILVAQLEREMTAERVKAKMVWIAEKGKVPAGRLPLGYRRKAGEKNEIEPDPETAPMVLEIFREYLARTASVADIRRRYHLNDKNQLYRMLRNPIYIGKVEYDGQVYQGRHEGIVPVDLFERVGALLPNERRAPRPTRQKYQYLLQGLVVCKCDKRMTPYSVSKKNGTRFSYYKCQDALGCGFLVNAERLDQAVLDQVIHIATDPKYIEQCYEEYRRRKAAENEAAQRRIKKAESEIADAQREIDDIDRLFLQGVVSPANAAHWNDKLQSARARLEHLQADHELVLNDLAATADVDELPHLIEQIRQWASELQRADDWQIRRNLILTLVHHVKCLDDDGSVELSLILTPGTSRQVMTGSRSDRHLPPLIITAVFTVPRRGRFRV